MGSLVQGKERFTIMDAPVPSAIQLLRAISFFKGNTKNLLVAFNPYIWVSLEVSHLHLIETAENLGLQFAPSP